ARRCYAAGRPQDDCFAKPAPPTQSAAIVDVTKRNQLATGHVYQAGYATDPAGGDCNEARGAGPDRMNEIKGPLAMQRANRPHGPDCRTPRSDVMYLCAFELPLSWRGVLVQSKDTNVVARGKPPNERKQRWDHAIFTRPIHTSWNH